MEQKSCLHALSTLFGAMASAATFGGRCSIQLIEGQFYNLGMLFPKNAIDKLEHHLKLAKKDHEVGLKDWIIILVCVIVVITTAILVYGSLTAPEGYSASDAEPIDISAEPIQVANPDTTVPVIKLAGNHYTIFPQANYKIAGMLVSKKHYLKGFMSKLSPWDYALIWGEVPNYLDYLEFDQVVRFCLYRYKPGLPLESSYINSHMSNNHLIPATKNIRKALSKAKKHDSVELEGLLVNVHGSDKKKRLSTWNGSLSRTDEGNGACEIVYVTRLRINDTVYE